MLALLFGMCAPSQVWAETFLTVADVPIDVTAKSASAARDKAIADVQAKAFQRLVRRMVAKPEDQARVEPSLEQIESFVQDFAVESERTSPVRYIGRFTVRFRAGKVRQYLIDSGIQSINELHQVLILPVYKGTDGPVLWGAANPWRSAWEQGGGGGEGQVTLILPNGDAYDKGTATPAAVASGDMSALVPLIQRYHAAGAVVVLATPHDPAKGPASGLSLTASTFDMTGPKGTQTLEVTPEKGDQPDKVLRHGVDVAASALQTGWQQAIASGGSIGLVGAAPPQPGQGQSAEAQPDSSATPGTLYPMAMAVVDLADWAKARDQLAQLPGVQRLSLDAVTRSSAAFTLDFAGDPLALQSVLASNGFVLVQTAQGTASGPGAYEIKRAPPVDAPPVGTPAGGPPAAAPQGK